jgi:hypothetical protein
MAVYWKPQEIRDLAEYCISIELFPEKWGFVRRLCEAQHNVLPADRRRPVRNVQEVQAIIDVIKTIRVERAQEDVSLQTKLPEPPPVPPDVPEAPPEPAAPAVEPRLADHSFDALIDAVITKLGDRILNGLKDQLAGIIREQQGATPEPRLTPGGLSYLHKPKAVARDVKPRVVVVGLLNQQAEDVEDDFKNQIDFTFVKSQQAGSGREGGHGMLNRSKKADVVIAMTKFIGHDVEKAAKSLDAPYVRVNGSVSGLKKWLTQYLNGEHVLTKTLHDFKDLKDVKP